MGMSIHASLLKLNKKLAKNFSKKILKYEIYEYQ